jgi:hypothetical protein
MWFNEGKEARCKGRDEEIAKNDVCNSSAE